MATGFPLTVNGHTIRTSEALYQMCKFPHLAEAQELLLAQRSPIMLARIARAKARPPRPDWDTVKLATMRWAVRLKLAQNWDTFGKLLLETGDLEIVEDSHRDAVVGDEGRVPHGVPRRVVVVPPVGLDDEHAPVRGGQGEVSQVRTERHLGGERQAELGHCLRQLPLDRRHRRPVGLSDRVGAGEQDAHLREQGGELLAGQQSQRLGQGGLIAERQLARAEEVAATLGEEVERDTPTERGQDDTVDERLEFVALEKEALGVVLEDDAPDAVSKDGGRRGGQELSSPHCIADSVEDEDNADEKGKRALNNAVSKVETELMMDHRAIIGQVTAMRQAGDSDAVIAQMLRDALDTACAVPKSKVKTSRAAIWTGTVKGMASERRGRAQEQARGLAEAERRRRSVLEAATGGANVDDADRRFRALWDTDKAACDATVEAGQKAAQQALGLRWGELGIEQRKSARRPYILKAFLEREKNHQESHAS